MKQYLVYSWLFIAACGDNNPATEPQTSNAAAEKKAEPSTSSAESDDIVGEWEMVGFASDTNSNLQIDEDERKNLKAAYEDYMKLNNDGSGLFTISKMEGRYEAVAREGKSQRFLTWYDKGDGRHRVGTIVFVSKDELHIKERDGNGIFVWKRL